jgi:hypothetical protein
MWSMLPPTAPLRDWAPIVHKSWWQTFTAPCFVSQDPFSKPEFPGVITKQNFLNFESWLQGMSLGEPRILIGTLCTHMHMHTLTLAYLQAYIYVRIYMHIDAHTCSLTQHLHTLIPMDHAPALAIERASQVLGSIPENICVWNLTSLLPTSMKVVLKTTAKIHLYGYKV